MSIWIILDISIMTGYEFNPVILSINSFRNIQDESKIY